MIQIVLDQINDLWPTIVLVLGIALLLYLFKLLVKLKRNYSKLSHVPGFCQVMYFPFRVPLLAPEYNLADWKGVSKLMQERGDKETKAMRVSLVFYNCLVLSDKNMLKEMFISKAHCFDKPDFEYEMINIFGENLLTALTTERWRIHHRACYAAFSDDNLRLVCDEAVTSTDTLLNTRWRKAPIIDATRKSVYINPSLDFSNLTLNVLGEAAFGLSFGAFDENEEGREFSKALEHLTLDGLILRRYILQNIPFLYPLLAKITGVKAAQEKTRVVLQRCIDQRKQELEKSGDSFERRDVLSLLVKANTQDKILTDEMLISNAFVLSIAGYHTSSATCQWALFELSKHKDIQERAREEVLSILGSERKPSFDDYQKFHYLNAVIMETLRLHPPITSVVKQVCKKETTLGKFLIPKGTEIDVFIGGVHTDPRYWENPYTFNPERFVKEEDKSRAKHDFSWIPFSAGNRKCIGYRFAEMEICMILSRLLQNYEFDIEDAHLVGEVVGVTVTPSNLKIKATPLC